jgi:hypothetical protein
LEAEVNLEFHAIVVEDARSLHEHVAAAIHAFGAAAALRFVLVYAHEQRGHRLLCGFFPMESAMRYRGLPFPHLRLWRHKHCFLGTPLLRQRHANRSLAAFLDWLAIDRHGEAMVEWGHVGCDGPFRAALNRVLDDRHRQGRW